jgi:transcriptional regulator with XRE-family HTH domain
MTISERMKKIREFRGLKQCTVAHEMNVTQQAYSCLENKSANLKLETLKRFSAAVKIELPFLLACEIPVTDVNMSVFDSMHYAVVFDDYKKLKSKLPLYEDIILKK